jgi:hypothetical protein
MRIHRRCTARLPGQRDNGPKLKDKCHEYCPLLSRTFPGLLGTEGTRSFVLLWRRNDRSTLGSFMDFKKRSSSHGAQAGFANHERTRPTQGDAIPTRGKGVVRLAWCGSMSARNPWGHQKYQQRGRPNRGRQVSPPRQYRRCPNATAPLAGRRGWNESARERRCTTRPSHSGGFPRVRVCSMRALVSPEEGNLDRRSVGMALDPSGKCLSQLK